jgi:conjugal transfer pilus assembly protein TraW
MTGMALMLITIASAAKDIGTVGPVYSIGEPDMLEEMQAKLREKEASGELAALQARAIAKAKSHIETPEPVAGVRRCQVERTYRFDPSVRFDEPVADDKGRVIVPAGTVVNPLAHARLGTTWLLFDARDPKQVEVVRAEIARSKVPIKPILVGGSPVGLMREWQRQVFFDQGGRIVERLGIKAVPARVSQEGLALLIQEFPPQ